MSERDLIIYGAKDLSRSIDYLETREDIDSKKLAYKGLSGGAILGAILPAVEKRFKASILISGSFWPKFTLDCPPEVNQINFISRVTVPTLMINGKYDNRMPVETAQIPFYNLLGTKEGDKAYIVCESGHAIPSKDCILYTNDWLDKYLGEVQ